MKWCRRGVGVVQERNKEWLVLVDGLDGWEPTPGPGDQGVRAGRDR